MRPGPRNAITDVAGIAVGQAEDMDLLTGVSVVLPDAPALATVDVRGGGPGTRETDTLRFGGLVDRVDAVVLSGGSAYGLEAASGVMAALAERGRGVRIGDAVVPIVPAAILFDLLTGPTGSWRTPPWAALGRQAVEAAGPEVALGNAGAGTGATAGPIKGGIGTASVVAEGVTVGALAAVNPLGTVTMPGTRHFWAWWLEMAGELGGLGPPPGPPADLMPEIPDVAPRNTTLAVVATDAALDRAGLARVAVMAQDGLARAIRPVHSPLDGDVVFALSTGRVPVASPVRQTAVIGTLAADAVSRAVMRGVQAAAPAAGIPAWRDLPPG